MVAMGMHGVKWCPGDWCLLVPMPWDNGQAQEVIALERPTSITLEQDFGLSERPSLGRRDGPVAILGPYL